MGYVRVSSVDQHPERKIEVLRRGWVSMNQLNASMSSTSTRCFIHKLDQCLQSAVESSPIAGQGSVWGSHDKYSSGRRWSSMRTA